MVIDAGVRMRPAPDAVVSLSAVPEVTTYPFPADARHLRSPIFQIDSTEDQLTQSGRDTRTLFHASPSPAKRLLLIPGAAHGVDLIGEGAGNRIRDAILAFSAPTPIDQVDVTDRGVPTSPWSVSPSSGRLAIV